MIPRNGCLDWRAIIFGLGLPTNSTLKQPNGLSKLSLPEPRGTGS